MKSETMWDRLANNWDTPGVSLGANDLQIIAKVKKYLSAGDSVLDYGCATGSIAQEIANTARVVRGIDLSSKMIEIARRKAEERKIKNIEFAHAAIFDESLKERSFDLILAFSVLHLLEDPIQVVDRIHQLLKPGGLFISATPCLGEKKFVSLLINIPVFLLSKIGILPHIKFFSVHGLAGSITNQKFQIVENESLSVQPITEHFVVAKKS
ncbi:MAG TPA: methyltransferase domain-containing protein [Anaerolineales bacterium]|nr:methyltransferase domain-containing protein [Anaerolineales bacterium]